jgi:hypothetical protein
MFVGKSILLGTKFRLISGYHVGSLFANNLYLPTNLSY